MKTAVVILNYNGLNHLKTFLPSVTKNTSEAEIWVADNGSTDESVSFLKDNYPDIKIHLIAQNLGFAGGYNEALKHIAADNYILLNSDVEVTSGWLSPLVNELQKPEVVACQPKIRSYTNRAFFEYAGAVGGYLDKLGYPFCRGRIFDTCEKDEGQYDTPAEILWATGACLAIRSAAFHDAGGFDESFFAHMEEIDLCWRLRNQGFTITCQPQSVVYHLGGGTLGTDNPHKTFLNFRNSLLMLYKNLPTGEAFRKIFFRLLLDGLSGIKFLSEGKWNSCLAIIRAHFAFYGMLGKTQKQKITSSALLMPYSITYLYFVRKIRKFSGLPHA